jgi:hypothetical protein
MLKHGIAIGVAVASLAGLESGFAQKMTEQYIPIGQSPGLSGEQTKIGNIEAVSVQEQALTVTGSSGSFSVQIAEDTHIWLDKSKMGSTNTIGTVSDLQAGRRIEVKYKDNDPQEAAEWIKVEILE